MNKEHLRWLEDNCFVDNGTDRWRYARAITTVSGDFQETEHWIGVRIDLRLIYGTQWKATMTVEHTSARKSIPDTSEEAVKMTYTSRTTYSSPGDAYNAIKVEFFAVDTKPARWGAFKQCEFGKQAKGGVQ